ncbi:MAG: CopG family transcriptional regulator [Deltaproteobacteria bacterium]|nr:MAG: CopG family transcriptional regulator [Deltaproteobacteria bacterium]
MSDTELPSPPPCIDCGGPTRAIQVSRRVRRGERSVSFDGWLWSCDSCEAEFGSDSTQFENSALAKVNAKLAAEAWLETHGEPFPDSRPPGPRRRFTERVQIRMDPDDVERLEALAVQRDQTRSEVVRSLIAANSPINQDFSPSPELESFEAERPEKIPFLRPAS